MANSVFLYWGSGSPTCWRVQIVLEEKGLGGYSNKLLSFSNKEHKAEEFLQLNPRGQVPTLTHGDIVLSESLAICDYLEQAFPKQGTKLIPDDLTKKALVIQRTHEAANMRSRELEDLTLYVIRTKPEDQKKNFIEQKGKSLKEELALWEGYLEKNGGDGYLTGADFTMADASFIPYLAFFWRIGANLETYPHLGAYLDKVRERPSVKASWPPRWLDTPNQTFLQNV